MAYTTLHLEFSGDIATITLSSAGKTQRHLRRDDRRPYVRFRRSRIESRARLDPDRRGQGILLRAWTWMTQGRRDAIAHGTHRGLPEHGAALPAHLEFSETHHRRRERTGHRGRMRHSRRCAISRSRCRKQNSDTRKCASDFFPPSYPFFWSRQIGEKHARDLLLTGKIIDAAEAHRLGLVTQIVASAGIDGCGAKPGGATVARCSPLSLHETKKLLCNFAAPEMDRELELAIAESAQMRSTQDFREGLASFLEKRPPRWASK